MYVPIQANMRDDLPKYLSCQDQKGKGNGIKRLKRSM